MPLYKRKIPVDKNANVKSALSTNTKKNVFQTPLKFNELKISNKTEEQQISENHRKSTAQKRQTGKIVKIPSAEFCISFDHIGADDKSSRKLEHKAKQIVAEKKEHSTAKSNKSKKKEYGIFENSQGIGNEKFDENTDTTLNSIKQKQKPDKRKNTPNSNVKHVKKSKTELTDEINTSCEWNDSIISRWSQDEASRSANCEPPEHLSYYERLLWLQEKRNVGLYVQCDTCDKFRFLANTIDPLDLPEYWYCSMNPDKRHNKCSDPEVEIPIWEEEDLIHNLYHAGSIVWAKMDGYPWWPAMVDDCPNTEMYYWLDEFTDTPTDYHVVFFDSKVVSRAWLKPEALHKFQDNIDNPMFQLSKINNVYKTRINSAITQAKSALKLNVPQRLKKYSFLARWPGKIKAPKDFQEEIDHKKMKSKKTSPKVARNRETEKNQLKRNKFSKSNFIQSPPMKISKDENNQNITNNYNSDYHSPDIFDGDDKIIDDVVKSITYEQIDIDELVNF